MHYKTLSIWIFSTLALLVAMMAMFPSRAVIAVGVIGLPLLVLLQAYIILKARDNHKDKNHTSH